MCARSRRPSFEVLRLQRVRGPGRWNAGLMVVIAATALGRGVGLPAQATAEKGLENRLKAVERERDELKMRVAHLELTLKQLRSTVDGVAREALGEQSAGGAAAVPPGGVVTRRPVGLYFTRLAPLLPPMQATPDVVELAVAFCDALGDKETARSAMDAVNRKVGTTPETVRQELDANAAQFQKAERKVRLLRQIVTTMRDEAAAQVERMHRLGAMRAVASADVQYAEGRLKVLELILAEGTETLPKPPAAGNPGPAK